MPRCVIINCNRPSISNLQRQGHISYHSFPHDPFIKEKWIAATGRKDWFPTKHSTICSTHFENRSFIETKKLRLLKKSAYPTIDILKFIDNNDEEDTIDEYDNKSKSSGDKETDDTEITEFDDETYMTSNLNYEIPVEDHPPSKITLKIKDPLQKPCPVRLPKAASSTHPTKNRLQSPSSSTRPPKKRFRSTSSTEEDELEDINRRLTAIEESRIEADMEIARAIHRQASALDELLGLARSFVNIYERNNRHNDNSTNEQSMEQCQTSNQQDSEAHESDFLYIKEELPE